MIKAEFSGEFDTMYRKLISEDPEMKLVILERIEYFRNNSEDTRLDNHPLKKSMEGKWAFSVTDDTRIVYEWVGKNTVRFLAIGGHEKVYRKS